MSCGCPLIVGLLLAMGCGAAVCREARQVDLAKLRDPATRTEEAIRILSSDDDGERDGYLVKDLRLYEVRDASRIVPLTLVLLSYGFDFSSRDWFSGYKIEDPDSLFRSGELPQALGADEYHAPVLDRLRSCSLILADAEGREVRFEDDVTYLREGYIFDFDGDGVLDVADTGNHGLGESDERGRRRGAHVLQVRSVGLSPRVLLRAAYNWELFPEKKEWGYECFDEEGDGVVEIAFGPKQKAGGDVDRVVVFRWNRETNCYRPSREVAGTPVFQLPAGELTAGLQKGYEEHGKPYLEARDKTAGGPDNRKERKAPDPPYEFRSLRGASDAEVLAFFRGMGTRDDFRSAGDRPSRLPDGFWKLAPKQAALQLAEANRSDLHRGQFRLVVDDRNGVAPPAAGWLVHDYRSDNSYTYITHLFAIRFGVRRPLLIHSSHSSQGMVGSHRLADQPGYGLRVLELSPEEARFVVDTVFWLDRIRSQGETENQGGVSSSADGWATLSIHAEGAAPRLVADDTIWAIDSIAARWVEDYEPETCLNLVEFFLADNWPARLGDRWNRFPALEHRYSNASIEERLKPRLDPAARARLSALALEVLAMNDDDPMPPAVLLDIVHAAGDEALAELEEPLRRLAGSLPPAGPEDEEFKRLRRLFARDHFGNPHHPGAEDDKAAEARLEELREKRRFLPAAVLRDPIAATLEKLGALGQPERLAEWARGGERGWNWALRQLARHHPELHARILREEFESAPDEQRGEIFQTLAAAHPEAALELRASFGPGELQALILDVAALEIEHAPEFLPQRIALLFEAAGSSGSEHARGRGRALGILARIELDQGDRERLERELFAEFEGLDQDRGLFSTKVLPTAVEILMARPDRERHWELFARTCKTTRRFQDFDALLDALVALSKEDPEHRHRALVDFVRHRLHESDGFVNQTIFAALALDMRELRDELQPLATVGPENYDGRGADTAGAWFTSPQDHRYHAARETLALWSEPCAATRARMWIAFVLTHGSEFAEGYRSGRVIRDALRQRVADGLRSLDPGLRGSVLDAMLEAGDSAGLRPNGTRKWLDGLCR